MNRTGTRVGGQRERGVALVLVLIVLLVVTILGLAAMRGTLMQERMSSNARERAMAFQSAENILREVELILDGGRPAGMPTTGICTAGMCGMTQNGAAPAWQASGFWTGASGYANSLDIEDDIPIKRYVIEDMGDGRSLSAGCTTSIDLSAPACEDAGAASRNYRITAFVRTVNDAEVMLQSIYQVP